MTRLRYKEKETLYGYHRSKLLHLLDHLLLYQPRSITLRIRHSSTQSSLPRLGSEQRER